MAPSTTLRQSRISAHVVEYGPRVGLHTLAVGILDGLDAVIFFGVRNGTPPARVFQAIAAGLLGRDGFSGGGPTAALGVALHFFIAFTIVAVFLFASRHVPALSRAPCIAGPAYGIAVYLVMNFVVIPLSATSGGSFTVPVVLNGVLIHIVGVGLPAVLAARAAVSGSQAPESRRPAARSRPPR